MPNKKAEFIRFNTIKEYINDTFKMRSADKTVKKFIHRFDTVIAATLKDAGALAKEDNRNTIMDQDIIPALVAHLSKENLTWQETAESILKKPPADLGKISKTINNYIEKGKN